MTVLTEPRAAAPARSERKDILSARAAHVDGLRAVAIFAVVGFHAGWPGFAHGYVGVDVFFVISGFLIINQIIERLEAGTFSIWEFYARRSLRILPAFLLMVLVSLILAKLILVSPREWEWYGYSASLSAVFFSNIYFLARQDYFDLSMFDKVLLHTWSLSVEEQFYILAPLILLVLFLVAARLKLASSTILMGASVVIFAASLAGCIYWTAPEGRNFSFYLAPLRAWEFVLGGMVGFLAASRSFSFHAALWVAASFASVLMIAASIGFGDLGGVFPGIASVPPVIGAALLIVCGYRHTDGVVIKALSNPAMVGIGLISYSWYLWHWPLLTFARTADFGTVDEVRDQLMIVLSLVLAIATYWLVERPVARWRRRTDLAVMSPRIVLAGAAACIVVFAVIGAVAGSAYQGAKANPLVAGPSDVIEKGRPDCAAPPCSVQPGSNAQVGFLTGDSHTFKLRETLTREAPRLGAKFLRISHDGESSKRDLDYVITIRRWVGWLAGDNAKARLRTELSTINDNGRRRLLVIGPVPVFNYSNAECVLRAEKYGLDWDRCALPRSAVDLRRASAIALLQRVVGSMPKARFIDPIDLFCDAELCRPYAHIGILYKDRDHVSQLGADWMFNALGEHFNWALGVGNG